MKKEIAEIKDKYDVFLFDMYGVLWNGKSVKQDFLETAEQLRKEGKKVIILSNTTNLEAEADKEYAERGIIKGRHYDEAATSGELAHDVFKNDDRKLKYYVIGWMGRELFKGTGYEKTDNPEAADFIYAALPLITDDVGKWHLQFDTGKFEEELQRLKKMGKIMICCNPDIKAFTNYHDEPIVVDGAFAFRYQEIGGEVEFLGKPYPELFDFALKDYDGDDERVLMIGDTLETDILGASSYGIHSMLVLGGVASYNMKQEGFDDIMEYIEEVGIIPNYIVV